jgi:hypothetical protein
MTPQTTKSQPVNTLIQRLKARFRRTVLPIVVKPAGARIVITSVPKAGTHLLEKTVATLPGYYTANMYIEQFEMPAQTFTGDANGQGEVKQARARQLTIDELQAITDSIKPGHYAVGHLVFSKPLAEMLDRTGVKVLCILRDPRDIAVSFSKYVARIETHYLYSYYQSLSEADRLMTTIEGTADVSPFVPRLLDISVQMKNMLLWRLQPHTYTTYFEKLVGPAGGGSREAQITEVRNIAAHLGAQCTQQQIESVADNLFGNTATFRKGEIGGWRNHFTPDHTAAFKRVAGQMLIDLGYEQDMNW